MINIRPATREDAGRILDFQLRMAEETENISLDKLVVAQGINALFDDPAKGVYYVAEAYGTVAGCFLITFEWSDWRNGTIWWLQSVYVDINHRQQRIFKRMYDYVIQTIKGDPSISGLRLYVDKSNERAQHVYQSMGMDGDHYTVFEWMK